MATHTLSQRVRDLRAPSPLVTRLVTRLVNRLVTRLVNRLVICLVTRLVARLVNRLVTRLVARLVAHQAVAAALLAPWWHPPSTAQRHAAHPSMRHTAGLMIMLLPHTAQWGLLHAALAVCVPLQQHVAAVHVEGRGHRSHTAHPGLLAHPWP